MATHTIYLRTYDGGGSLADLDATPTLSDSTGAYGVKNTSTDNIIVADGAEMTHDSTGVYSYELTFGAAEDDDTVTYATTYTWAVEMVYLGNTYRKVENFTTRASTAATSTLERDYDELVAAVDAEFPEYETQEYDIIRDGYMLFLYPPEVTVSGVVVASHQWGFLSPKSTLSVSEDDYDIDLPAAFGGLVGNQIFISSTSTWYPPVDVVTPEEIEGWRVGTGLTGTPRRAAVRPKEFTPATGMRYELVLDPTPDDDYTLIYRYNVNPNAVASGVYPIGGVQHSLTIKAAVMAAAELRALGGHGSYYEAFLRRLQASVRQDQRYRSPNLGPIEDTAETKSYFQMLEDTVRFNGVDVDT